MEIRQKPDRSESDPCLSNSTLPDHPLVVADFRRTSIIG